MEFRWLNTAGFEIVLPDGAHLLVDPWLDSAAYHSIPVSAIERADYIVISHIHEDHAADVRRIQEKFPDVRIFVPAQSAEPLTKWLGLDTSRLYKVNDEQEFRFDNVTIRAFAGRHTEADEGNYLEWDETGELTPGSWGTLDLYQYLITDSDGTEFMVWAGTPSEDNAYTLAGLRPDLAAVHVSPKQDFSMLARVINSMDPRVFMPHHHDIWPFILERIPPAAADFPAEVQPVTPENVVEKMMPYVEQELADGGVTAEYFTPEHHEWYHYDPSTKTPQPGTCREGSAL